MIKLNDRNQLFHVHTYRCHHAENIGDEQIIKKALLLGFQSLWFTDHAPFPNNPFFGRMKFEDLSEYIETISQLKEKYINQIDIHVGLEIEYFKQYHSYYESLLSNSKIEILILGQHMGSMPNEEYTFAHDRKLEIPYITENILQGLETKMFSVLAHPDRVFKNVNSFNTAHDSIKNHIVETANKNNIFLEDNMSSLRDYPIAYNFFWNNIIRKDIVYAADAHCLKDIEEFNFLRGKKI